MYDNIEDASTCDFVPVSATERISHHFCAGFRLLRTNNIKQNGAQDIKYHTYAYSGGANTVARFELTYTSASDVGQVVMIIKNSNVAPTHTEKQLSYYQHFSPTASPSKAL